MKHLFLIGILIFSLKLNAQNYWSISLPLSNFQRVANVLNTNEFGVHYENVNSYSIFSLQLLRSNKWSGELNINSCAGEMIYGGLNQLSSAQNIDFKSGEDRIYSGSGFENNAYISRIKAYQISDVDYYFDFEFMLYKGFSISKNSMTFRNLEFIVGGGLSYFYPALSQTSSQTISILKKDEKEHLYGINYRFSRFPVSCDFVSGFEIYEGQHFHLGLRFNATYLVYNQQSVSITRISGVAKSNKQSISDNFSSSWLLGGKVSLKYHLNVNQENQGKSFGNGFRKLIFRY